MCLEASIITRPQLFAHTDYICSKTIGPWCYTLQSANRVPLDQPPSSTIAAIFTPCIGHSHAATCPDPIAGELCRCLKAVCFSVSRDCLNPLADCTHFTYSCFACGRGASGSKKARLTQSELRRIFWSSKSISAADEGSRENDAKKTSVSF